MIGQAFSAELFKISCNRWSAFWAFGFVPAITLVFGLIAETWIRFMPRGGLPVFSAPITAAREGLGSYGTSIAMLFPIIGAAILFAGEYRWETWRAILPRTSRPAVLTAKALVFALFVSISIFLCGLAMFLVEIYKASYASSVLWPTYGGPAALGLIVTFAVTLLQSLATMALVVTVAVFSRSLITAIIAPFVVLIGCELVTVPILLSLPIQSWDVTLYPNIAGRALRGLANALAGDPDAVGARLALPAFTALAMWLALFWAAAIFLFRRQDLSRE